MQVVFTKLDAKRYTISIDRAHGPRLVPRFGPGYDDLMPHDLAHYVVEEFFRIELGVWGQLAAGGGGIFWPAPEDDTLRNQRRVKRIGAVGRRDMRRSEQLVVLTVTAWERAIGRVKQKTRTQDVQVEPDTMRRAVARMNEVAQQWRALPYGAALTVDWPAELTFDVRGSQRGRRRRSAESARR
jgi:hypothetical protein